MIVATQLVAARGLRGLVGLREVEVTVAMTAPGRTKRRCADRPRPRATPRRQSVRPRPGERPRAARHRRPPRRAGGGRRRPDPLVAQLLSTGLDPRPGGRVAPRRPRGPRRTASAAAIEAALATELGGLVSGDEPFAPVELFVGPPGAGKTTTIAKIAARERATRGRK